MQTTTRKKLGYRLKDDRTAVVEDAALRVASVLDYYEAHQAVVDEARQIVGADYGILVTTNDASGHSAFVTSGFSSEERRNLSVVTEGPRLLAHLNQLPGTLRVPDITDYANSWGISPKGLFSVRFLGAPISYSDQRIGDFFLGRRMSLPEFSDEDEEILGMFLPYAGVAIANARLHVEERRARAELEFLIDSSPLGILVFDAKTGHLVKFNEEMRQLVGRLGGRERSLTNLLDTFTFRRPDGRDVPLEELPLAKALMCGETVRAEEIVIGNPEGGSISTLVNAKPIRSEDGDIVMVVCTVQDMTPLKEVERRQAEFFDKVSSRLRAPLTTIKGSTATLLGSSSLLDPSETLQFFQTIDEQADQMIDLVNQIMALARIESGGLSITPEATELEEIVNQAWAASAKERLGHFLETRLPKRLPRVHADRARLGYALTILLANAVRLSPEGSAIKVTASRSGMEVMVSVATEGEGIPEDQLDLVFTKYYRSAADDKSSRTVETGLAFAICKGIVEAHGGRVWAESDGLYRGTRFSFTIPVAPTETNSHRPPYAPALPPGRLATVLAVDGDAQTLTFVQEALAEAGFVALVTFSPGEAEHLVNTQKVQLMLLDAALIRRKEGLSLLRRTSEVAVIVMSNSGSNAEVEQAFEMGASDYIAKPFSADELMSRVGNTLLRRAAADTDEHSRTWSLDSLVIDYAKRAVSVAGRPAQLTTTEYNLLAELSLNAGRVLSQEYLMQRIWGQSVPGDSDVLRTYIMYLRKKLGDSARNPKYIFTEAGVGYRMAAP